MNVKWEGDNKTGWTFQLAGIVGSLRRDPNDAGHFYGGCNAPNAEKPGFGIVFNFRLKSWPEARLQAIRSAKGVLRKTTEAWEEIGDG